MSDFGYGYKLRLKMVNPYGNLNDDNLTSQDLERTIFVPAEKIWTRVVHRHINPSAESPSTDVVIGDEIRKVFPYDEPSISWEYSITDSSSTTPSATSVVPTPVMGSTLNVTAVINWPWPTPAVTANVTYTESAISDNQRIQWTTNNQILKQYCYSEEIPDEDSIWVSNPIYCGKYQVPSGVKISEISLFDQAQMTVNYKAHFNLDYLNSNVPQYYEIVKPIAGQINGLWQANQDITPEIKNKYYAHIEENNAIYEYSLDSWSEMQFIGEQDFIEVSISTPENSNFQNYKLDEKGLYYEIEEENKIKKIYLDPNIQINKCTILSDSTNGINGIINYKAYLMQRIYK